jgi:hypothetical protein
MRLDRDTAETRAEVTPPLDPRHHLSRCLQQRAPQDTSRADAAAAEGAAARISLEAEVPEVLFDGMRAFLQSRPDWDQYRLITTALAGFLFQNGCGDRCVAQHYLNGLFMRTGE